MKPPLSSVRACPARPPFWPPQPRWLALPLAAVLAACNPQASNPAGAAGKAPPPMPVGVVTVQPAAVALTQELPGRLEAARTAQIRARVPGIVAKRLFTEGSRVVAGQPLFQLESAALEAQLASAQAQQAKAEANLTQAQALAERYEPLWAAKAISQQEYVAAQAAFKQARADVALAQAAVQTARINLGYASIAAPIGGLIGRALVTEGALVGQGEATAMAVVQQIDPLYVNITQSANEVLQLRRALDGGQLRKAGAQAASVRLLLEDGSPYPLAGRLLFSDVTVDANTGQITLRAEVPNPKGLLLPGLYVRVQLQQAEVPQGFAVPQQAVTRNAGGDSVLVVDGQGQWSPRPVVVGGQQGGNWVITQGLQAGEQVMVDGFQKLRPGAAVQPVPWQPPAPKSAENPAQPRAKSASGAA